MNEVCDVNVTVSEFIIQEWKLKCLKKFKLYVDQHIPHETHIVCYCFHV